MSFLSSPAAAALSEGELAPLDVLIIDDEATVRQVLGASLTATHYTFAAAADGREAVAALKRHRFQLVVTDIFMPHMDGLELIRRCRAIDPRTLILTCSGGGQYAQEETALRTARLFGSHRTLTKPFTVAQFLATLREMIGPRAGWGEASDRSATEITQRAG